MLFSVHPHFMASLGSNNFVLSLKVWIQKTDATSDKKIGNAVRSLFSFLLLSDAEVLEDVVQRFLAADLAAGDFAQLLQYHFQILGDDVAAHSHFH